MKKFIMLMILLIASVTVLFACSNSSEEEAAAEEVLFWSAPNVQQFEFYTTKAEEYNAEHPDQPPVVVEQMPETPSSEAGIQAAVASGTTPVAAENITRGFATELYESEAIIPLDEIDGFNELVESRNMTQVIEGWKIDGQNYVFPIYSCPILMAWNVDLLNKYNDGKVPTTYDEVYQLAENIAASGDDVYATNGVKHLLPADWWELWFNTFTLYYSQSNGQPFYENNELVADEQAMIDTLTYIDTIAGSEKGMLLSDSTDPFANQLVVTSFVGGWETTMWEETYPELVYNQNYVLTPPVNSDGTGQYTFADSKGAVFFANHSDEEYAIMMDFLAFCFTDEGDAEWLGLTNLPPARDDLLTNETFATYFAENPTAAQFAECVPYAIPSMSSANMVDIQTMMGEEILKMINDEATPEETWEAIKTNIESISNE